MYEHYQLINERWVLYNQNSSERYRRGLYANKIHVKDTVVVPIYRKFNIEIPESLYRSKIASSGTTFMKKAVSGEAIFTI